LAYNKWTTQLAHSLGLGVAMKNAVGLIPETNGWYDLAVNEQCGYYQECGAYSAFTNSNRLVAGVEYSGPGNWCSDYANDSIMGKWCPGSQDNGLCDNGSSWHDCFTPWEGRLPPIHWTSGSGA
jgi:Glycoside-hydrolase family GH114